MGALGCLKYKLSVHHKRRAQTLSVPPAPVHFVQVIGSSTDFSELRISRGIAEIIYELVLQLH